MLSCLYLNLRVTIKCFDWKFLANCELLTSDLTEQKCCHLVLILSEEGIQSILGKTFI